MREGSCETYFKDFNADITIYGMATKAKPCEFITSKVNKSNGYNVVMNYMQLYSQDWSKYKYIVFPELNTQPEEPAHAFWILCGKLFT